jgi:hypothetical protein
MFQGCGNAIILPRFAGIFEDGLEALSKIPPLSCASAILNHRQFTSTPFIAHVRVVAQAPCLLKTISPCDNIGA